ncbi:hypothetical protein QJS66_05430 [Kocuria rhizophila]|nr:hypothetical protein QJS66_05430 [Kocuria rhizophila]
MDLWPPRTTGSCRLFDFWNKARGRHQADHRRGGLPHAGHRPPGPHPREVRGRRPRTMYPVPAPTRHDPARAVSEGMQNLFRASTRRPCRASQQAPHGPGSLLNQYGKGLIATTGCPVREVQTRLRLGQTTRPAKAAAEFRQIFGAENFDRELMDDGLGIEKRVTQDLRLAKDQPAAVGHERPALQRRRGRQSTRRCCAAQSELHAAGPQALQVRRGTSSTPSPQQMRELFRDFPEARADPGDRRALRGGVRHLRQLHAALPHARGGGRDPRFIKGREGAALPLPGRDPARCR